MRLFLSLILFFTINLFSKELKSDGYYRYVQVLAIRDFSRAQKLMKKLDKNGYSYVIRDSVKRGDRYYRVVVGPFPKDSIKQEQEKLNKLLYLKSSFILTYEEKPTTTVKYEKTYEKVTKQVSSNYSENKSYKERIDNIVKLSVTKENFAKNRDFVCSELKDLVSNDYPPAILLLASNYIKGDECVEHDLTKAIEYLNKMQNKKLNLPKNLSKFSKELLAETYIKTMDRDNFLKAKKLFDELLLDETNSNKYMIYLYKRLAYIEYFIKEYKYMNMWLEQSAKLGDIESQLNLGKNYLNGIGENKNIDKAIYWLEQCVDKDMKCGENLGRLYLNINLSIAPNLDEAFINFAKSAKLGSSKSKLILSSKNKIEEFYSLMQRDEIQYELIFEYIHKYIPDRKIENIFITNINKKDKEFDVYVTCSLDEADKVAKIVLIKNRYNYWIVKNFKLSDSLLTLK